VRELGEQLLHEGGDDDRWLTLAGLEALLLLVDDLELVLKRPRIVRPRLGPETVLERRDDPTAARVVLRVRRRDDVEIQGQPDREAANLDVPLFEDVEQADLDPLGEVGELVDREDPPVRSRDQAVVERQLVAEIAAFRDADLPRRGSGPPRRSGRRS
jgi:hypothetical protein